MSRISIALSLVVLAACSSSEPAPPKVDQAKIDERNAALLKQHNEIWSLMGLSQSAKDELNGLVTGVNAQMMKNKMTKPEDYERMQAVKRADPKQYSHEEYVANHKRRFDALKISAATQKELMAAADFVFSALHDPDAATKFTEDQRKTAAIIQKMMKDLAGPPPCCDDNIFERAKP